MAKVKRRNADGTVKKKNRKSRNQKQKLREKDVEKRTKFNNKKAEEQQGKDAMAREAALERLGITQEFGFEDHAGIYSYADNNSPINEAPIKIVDASVDPPALTSYPEYPISEFSSPPAFDINVAVVNVALKSTQATVHTASRDSSRLRRAKRILRLSQSNQA